MSGLRLIAAVSGIYDALVGATMIFGRPLLATLFDFYEPIRTALRFLDERLTPGGYVVVDDYGWFCSGAKTALDEFIAEHPERYELTLPHRWAGHFAVLAKKP